MKASEAIHDRIHGPGHCDPPCGLCMEVIGLLEDYAHELAEQIRAKLETLAPECCDAHCSAQAAADLIDPEVLNSGG